MRRLVPCAGFAIALVNALLFVKKLILVGAGAVLATACTATVGLPAGAHLTISSSAKPATTSTAATTAAAVADLQNQFLSA